MATISSPGLGSGLDVNGIVSQLVALERRPIALLEKQTTTLQAKLSAFGLLQSYTVNLRDAVARLGETSLWEQNKATSSDAATLTVSAGASAVKGSYSVEVTQLAQAQALASKAYGSATAAVGSGTLHLALGSWNADKTVFTPKTGSSTVDVTIAPGATLEDVRSAINAANAGVTASIVTDAAGAKLVLRSGATGEENALRLTVTADAGTPSLADLAYDPPGGTTLTTETLAAKNAVARIDGLAVTSATNTLSGVVEGLTLKLVKVNATPVQVTAGVDSDAMRKALDDFVKAYNDINRYIADQTKYNEETKVAGALQGDRATLSLQNQLRSVLREASGASASFARLSDAGLALQRDGALKIDDAKLSAAMNGNLAELAKAFSHDDASAAKDGFALRIKALAAALTGSDGLVNTRSQGLRDSIKRAQAQVQKQEDRVAAVQERLLRQYSALDTQLNGINGLGGFVSQQIALWNKSKA